MLIEYILNALEIMPERFKNIEKKLTQCECYSIFKNVMEGSIESKLKEILNSNNIKDIKVKAHVAQGRPAYIPWIGFHYIKDNIDSNSQTGIYTTILFKADGSGIVLSLQTGTENLNEEKIGIRTEALIFKYKKIINKVNTFSKNKLDLKGTLLNKKMLRCEKYEKASILSLEYNKEQLKNKDCNLEEDLIYLIDVYKKCLDNGMNNKDLDISSEEFYQSMDVCLSDNEYKKFANKAPKKRKKATMKKNNKTESNKVSRDEIQGKIALENANFKCEYDINHITFLNSNNQQFMEKHHLIPMEYYFDFENNIDDHHNIYSLCPTCHSQIHYGKSKDQKILIEKLLKKRKDSYKKYYDVDIKKLFELYGINE